MERWWPQFASANQRMGPLRRRIGELLNPAGGMPAHRPAVALGALERPLVGLMWRWFEHLARQGNPCNHVQVAGCPAWLQVAARRALGIAVRRRTRSERRWVMRRYAAASAAVASVLGISPRTFDEGMRAWRDAKIKSYLPSLEAASTEELATVLASLKAELNPTFAPVSLSVLCRWTAA